MVTRRVTRPVVLPVLERVTCRHRLSSGTAFNPASTSPYVWYDVSDFSTMFQDTAGTVPVTATGQTVARVNDKSGNGNTWLQGTAAARPSLQQDGNGKYYLSFDTVDDYISSTFGSTATLGSAVVHMAVQRSDTCVGVIHAFNAPNRYIATAQAGSGATTYGASSGTPSHFVNEVAISPNTRDGMATAWPIDTNVVVGVTNVDMNTGSPWTGVTVGYYPLFAGFTRCYGLFVHSSLSGGDLTSIVNYLKGNAGI